MSESKPDSVPPARPTQPNLLADAKAVSKKAAIAGAILAVLCHLLPPHYRVICDQVAAICRGEF